MGLCVYECKFLTIEKKKKIIIITCLLTISL